MTYWAVVFRVGAIMLIVGAIREPNDWAAIFIVALMAGLCWSLANSIEFHAMQDEGAKFKEPIK